MAKLPEGWIVADLGEFCEGIRGVAYKPDDLAQVNTEKTITLLRSNNIKAGALNFKDVQHVAQKNVNQKQVAQLGDIAVCMSNGSKRLVGKSAAFKHIPEGRRYTVGSFCSIFRPLESACPVFVEQVFCSDQFQKQVDFSLAGSAINNLKNSDLIAYQFLKPPIPEQQKIATILSSVDDVIEKTRAQIDKLKDLKTGMMQELLTKGIGHTEFKDSPVGRIPQGWVVYTAQELLDLKVLLKLQDGNHGSQYPRAAEFISSGVPYIAASHISEFGEISFNSCPHLSQTRADDLRIRPAKGGDVILTHNATVGRTAIIPDNKGEVIASTSTTYYRTNNSKLLNKYLYYYFQSTAYVSQLQSIMGQTTRNQVPITAQRELLIIVPPIEDQASIANVIEVIVSKIKS